MFATTKLFLDYFGLKKLDDLPPLADLSDWESLRVQLNLPEVDEDSAPPPATVTDLPVLYPEGSDDVAAADDAESDEVPVADADADVEGSFDDDENPELPSLEELDNPDLEDDELVVSEWPDPAKSGG